MTRIALALLVAIPMTALTYFAVAQDKPEHHGDYDACAKACLACQKECDTCAAHCTRWSTAARKNMRLRCIHARIAA